MHPSHKDLRHFIKADLDAEISAEIAHHIENCVFCRESCEEYRLMQEANISETPIEFPSEVLKFAEKLFPSAKSSKIINLIPISDERKTETERLAADSKPGYRHGIENLATLYSEEPELVLRVMRNNDRKCDYLHLIGDIPGAGANVMIQIPGLDKEFITDNEGMVALDKPLENISDLNWQIKMPDADFTLEPLKYDPESVEYSKELEFETDRNDKIKVTFEGKTEGMQISIQILELDGEEEFGGIKVIISQKDNLIIKETSPNKSITYNLNDSDSKIIIRLFQK